MLICGQQLVACGSRIAILLLFQACTKLSTMSRNRNNHLSTPCAEIFQSTVSPFHVTCASSWMLTQAKQGTITAPSTQSQDRIFPLSDFPSYDLSSTQLYEFSFVLIINGQGHVLFTLRFSCFTNCDSYSLILWKENHSLCLDGKKRWKHFPLLTFFLKPPLAKYNMQFWWWWSAQKKVLLIISFIFCFFQKN